MTKATQYVLAVAVALSAGALIGPMWTLAADDMGRDTGGVTAMPPAKTDVDLKNAKGADETTGKEVRRMLARLVNNAYSKGELNDVVGYASKEDRDRLGKVEKNADIDGRLDKFNKDFKDKYGQAFDCKEEHLKDIQVLQGRDKNHVIVITSGLADTHMTGAKAAADKGDIGKATGEMIKSGIEKAGGQGVTLNLVNEGTVLNAWRINIPNDMSLKDLENSLLKHITLLDESKDKWPQDLYTAHKLAAEHVFEALSSSAMASEK